MIATCCHQKCTWATYVNRPFLEGLGIDEEAFALITLMSSWATANEAGEEMREGNVLVSDQSNGRIRSIAALLPPPHFLKVKCAARRR